MPGTLKVYVSDMDRILLIILLGLAVVLFHQRSRSKRLPYPPGPRPDLLIGNFRQIPKTSPWLTYARWKKTYGEVVFAETMGKSLVILNSLKAVSEMFEKRGSIYSDRPYNAMIQLMNFDSNVIYLSHSEQFRSQRKLLNVALNPSAVVDYIPVQEKETYAMLERFLDTPDCFYKHVRRTASSVILTIGYGHTVVSDDDHFVSLAEDAVNHLRQALQPSSFFVNLVPALRYVPTWFPFANFHRHAQRGRQLYKDLREKPFEMVKSQIVAGTAPHSYTSRLLDAKGTITGSDDEEQHIQETAAALYGAGSDTSVSSVVTFILAMVLNPDVQRRAQAELDSVLGRNKLPTISDKPLLPYINCIVLEVLRWQPVTALGVPHALREDDVYEGYFIPRGSIVTANIWAMAHDEELYSDPMKFWPERFDGRFPDIKDPLSIVFGFGRRTCPGRHLAVNSVFLAIACLLSCFKFSKARDMHGKEEEPLMDYSEGPPKNFRCQIIPRSADVVALIRAAQAMNRS